MPRFGVSRQVLATSLGLALDSCNDATDPEIQRVEHRLSVTLARAGAARVRVVGLSAATRGSVLDSAEVTVRIRG
jgi:hypothetical protein